LSQVWSATFDPGRNANMQKKVSGGYYDRPAEGDNKSVWNIHLESQKSQAEAPTAAAALGGDAVDAAEVKRMLSADRVDAALRKATSGESGKVDFTKLMQTLRQGS
jgi:hypothetical protein